MAASTPAQIPAVIFAPFYRVHSDRGVSPAESKPVYLAALNLWCTLNRWIHPGPMSSERYRAEFFNFTLFTFWLLALLLIRSCWRFGLFYEGILASILVLLSSWSLVYFHYPAYLQLSMFLFLLALMRLSAPGDAAVFQSGMLSALALLSNNTLAVYVLGLVLLIFGRSLPKAWVSVRALLDFLKGFALVFVFFEVINSIGLAEHLTGSSNLDTPLRTLMNYYKRSVSANHFKLRGLMEVPKQPFLLLSILRYQSWTMLILCISLPLTYAACVFRKGWQQSLGTPELRRVAALWLPAITGLVLMDFVPGIVQLGRGYFMGYALLVVGGVLFWSYLQKQFKPLRWLGMVLLISTFGETAIGLANESRAFHGLIWAVKPDDAASFALFRNDPHDAPIRHLLGEKVSEKLVTVTRVEELGPWVADKGSLSLLAGPEIETILFNGWSENFNPMQSGILHVQKGLRVKVGLPKKIPYYGLYPPLIFEDEFDMWRFKSLKEFGENDYKNGRGAITLWPLTREQVADDDDVTALAEKIIASSAAIGYGPELLRDGGSRDVHAWHSKPRPDYPVVIEVVFKQRVLLERVAFQAQFGNDTNLRRSPREVKILGGQSPHAMEELARFRLDFGAGGFWQFCEIKGGVRPFQFYQLVIMDNHGNKDYVTLQELKFFGRAVRRETGLNKI